MQFRTHKRAFGFAPLLAAIALMTACDDDPVEPEEHADVDAILLTIGGDEYEIEGGGDQSITIPLGATDVSAAFLDHDGEVVEVHDDEFELRLLPVDEGIVTFTRADAFSGALNGQSEGSTTVDVELYHLEEGHSDFDVDLNVTVEP